MQGTTCQPTEPLARGNTLIIFFNLETMTILVLFVFTQGGKWSINGSSGDQNKYLPHPFIIIYMLLIIVKDYAASQQNLVFFSASFLFVNVYLFNYTCYTILG